MTEIPISFLNYTNVNEFNSTIITQIFLEFVNNSQTKFICYKKAILEIKVHKIRLNSKVQSNILPTNINQKKEIEEILLPEKIEFKMNELYRAKENISYKQK